MILKKWARQMIPFLSTIWTLYPGPALESKCMHASYASFKEKEK